MERTCSRFVSIFSFVFISHLNSFVFIIEIGYILLYLMLLDKCLRCVSFSLFIIVNKKEFPFVMRHLLSALRFLEIALASRLSTSTCMQLATKEKLYRIIFTCFFGSHACCRLSQSVHVLSSALSLLRSHEHAMNENVFYVILHNIIVFNKQISLSLHLIVKR